MQQLENVRSTSGGDHQSGDSNRRPKPRRRPYVKPEQRREHAVEPRRIELALGRNSNIEDAHQVTGRQNRQEEQVIEVEMLPGGQICAIQLLDELREAIAPLMMTDFVLQTPKEWECRNGQQEMSAWLQHAAQLA